MDIKKEISQVQQQRLAEQQRDVQLRMEAVKLASAVQREEHNTLDLVNEIYKFISEPLNTK